MVNILDPDFKYQNDTDVQRTWRKFGWKPKGETDAEAGRSDGGDSGTLLDSVDGSDVPAAV